MLQSWGLRLHLILFFKILCVTCGRNSSLSFVIDYTGSMQDDIDQVKVAAADIMDLVMKEKASEIEDVVIVTFNDPMVDVREKSPKKAIILKALNEITAYNLKNHDCPEYSLTGIELALVESRPGSYLFVFTDATAKDYYKLNQVKRLCEKKQSQVVFVLTGDCNRPNDKKYKVYHEIAMACNGQVFRVQSKEVTDVLETIKETVKGQKSVLTSQVVPRTPVWFPVAFTVDDKTEYVVISTSSKDVDLVIMDNPKGGSEMTTSRIMWKNTGKVVKFSPPKPSTYYAWVKGQSDISIVVYARTDFTFEHGFSTFVPKSLRDTSKQPIADLKHHLSISVTDPNHTVDIKTAEILDMNEKLLQSLPLQKANGDFYITKQFVSPSSMFKIQVIGINKNTGYTIKRISKTAIEPQIPPKPDSKAPKVTISEGTKISVEYDGDITLTCKVSAYPKPNIAWTRADGTVLSTKSSVVELPYEYISYFKLAHVKNPTTYYCRASNEEARNKFSKIDVNPQSPFKVMPSLAATTPSKYGATTVITCNIKSMFPMKIKWFHQSSSNIISEIHTSDKYMITLDGKNLRIYFTVLDRIGKYSCQASLDSDETQKVELSTDVQINDLSPPVIQNSTSKYIVNTGQKSTILCKIDSGTPPPTVSWQFMKKGDNKFRDLHVSGQMLTIDSTSLSDAGKYRCIATNAQAQAETTNELIVKKAPEATIDEGASVTVPYGSPYEFKCTVVAYPPPTIVWKDSKGHELTHSQETINDNEIVSKLKVLNAKTADSYFCYAENDLGMSVKSVHLTVLPAIAFPTNLPVTKAVKYGSPTHIICDARSLFPMKIKWFYQNENSSSDIISEIHASDKYILSPDERTLHVAFTGLQEVGKYTCEASLASDDKEKKSFTTRVEINDLSAPKIITSSNTVTIMNGQKMEVVCKITGGVPPPSISWQFKKNTANEYSDLSESSENFIVASAGLANNGQYRCIAKNSEGNIEKITKVIVQKLPTVVIEDGSKKSVAYGSTNTLTCKIEAYPLPGIMWKDGRGNKLASQDNIINNEITSHLQIQNIRASNTYFCFAENNVGRAESKIDISVTSAIVVGSYPPATTTSKYGATTVITCNIKSMFPMKIKWFHQGSSNIISEIHTSDKYMITQDGKNLRIYFTDLDRIGKYSCKASLDSDETQKVELSTDVQINDLSPPVIQNSTSKYIVNTGQKSTILCKIDSGTPPPAVSWQFMKKGDNKFRDLHVSGQMLTIDSTSLSDAGKYRCIATNAQAQANKTNELIVKKAPKANIDEGASVTVPYGSPYEFKCRVVANPPPTIVWNDSKGHELTHSQETINNNEIVSKLKVLNAKTADSYSCYAENDLGKSVKSVHLTVLPAIAFPTNLPVTKAVKYGSPTNIICDARSLFPMKIKWFYQNENSSSDSISEIHASDKYILSPDERMLHIAFTGLEEVGKYTCEASLASDDKEKNSFTTKVEINDLSAPKIITSSNTVIIMNGQKMVIVCKISGGVPPPSISWQFKKNTANEYSDLSESSENFIVASASLANNGQYRCIAKNSEGKIEKITKVIVQKLPTVVIEDGSKKSVAYGSTNTLTCKIEAYPLPGIMWKDGRGNKFASQDNIINYEITSHLQIQNIRASNTYSCFAENNVGRAESKIDISVTSAIVVGSYPPATTTSKYGATTVITCNIKSMFPMKIKWFHQSSSNIITEIHTSDKYMITQDGKNLRIYFTDLDRIGKYSCKASLDSDETQNVELSTDVQINDLSPPVIQNSASMYIVNTGQKSTIPCKIEIGTPPPAVSWQFMKKGDNKFRDLHVSGQMLTIDSTSLSDAGKYRCIATNAQAQANKTNELIVKKAPKANIDEGASVTVPYGSPYEFKCRVVAYPPPTIVWKDSKGHELTHSQVTINDNEIVSKLKVNNAKTADSYSCYAENDLGKSVKNVHLTVLPAIAFPTNLPVTKAVKYGSPTNIICDARSLFPMKIKWFYQNENSSSDSISEIHASDKYILSPDERMLHIAFTGLEEVGKYTCEASLASDDKEKKSFTTKVEINDLSAPKIITSSNTVTIMNGQKMDIVCEAKGTPDPVVTWQFKPVNSKDYDLTTEQGKQIIKPKIGYEHAGSYKCTATNAIGSQNRTIDVNVHGKPKITNVESVIFGVTGDKVLKIPCQVTGVPEPTITWKREGIAVTTDAKITFDKNSLFIKNPIPKDSSNFTCEANNKYGNDVKHFEAEISDFIEIDKENSKYIYLKPGESTVIKCDLPDSGPKSVRWYVNADKDAVQGSSYSLQNANFSNDGNYTCRVNTDQGSASVNYVVDVGYKPSFTRPQATPIFNWNGNKKDILDCNVQAKPTEKVVWFYNAKALNNKGTELPISGWGYYTCNVSNVHGSVQQTFNVTSDGCVIDRTVDKVQNIPLLLISDTEKDWPILTAENEFYKLKKNEKLTLECSTIDQPNNMFKTHPKTKEIIAECYKEDQFTVDGKMYKFQDLQCVDYVKPTPVDTNKPCMTNGKIVEIGFKLSKSFLGVYDVCYSESDHRTLYSKMTMSDINMGNIIGPAFKLNSNSEMSDVSFVKCQYNQRRFVNPVDVAFGPPQIATLMDKYNSVPVFEPCDKSSRASWSNLEEVFQSAMYVMDTYTMWTGASKFNEKGVPRYLWKVIKYEETTEAIVYVNSPDAESKDILCSRYSDDGLSEPLNDKYTYNCPIDEFLKIFEIPASDFGITA